jgi:hypothetical protein
MGLRFEIKYFPEETERPLEMLDLIQKHCKEDTLSQSQVYHGIAEVRRETTGLSDAPKPERTPYEAVPDAVRRRIQEHPKRSARKVARILCISHTAITRCLKADLVMKCFHCSWVPHRLARSHRDSRVANAKDMLQ